MFSCLIKVGQWSNTFTLTRIIDLVYERNCGVGCERNYDESFDWLESASKNDHPYAKYRLGIAYMIRFGMEKYSFEAAIWFSAAALKLARFRV